VTRCPKNPASPAWQGGTDPRRRNSTWIGCGLREYLYIRCKKSDGGKITISFKCARDGDIDNEYDDATDTMTDDSDEGSITSNTLAYRAYSLGQPDDCDCDKDVVDVEDDEVYGKDDEVRDEVLVDDNVVCIEVGAPKPWSQSSTSLRRFLLRKGSAKYGITLQIYVRTSIPNSKQATLEGVPCLYIPEKKQEC
jgi:hypothetical protein